MSVQVEILTIGREILDGRVIDTNSVFLAESLKQRGLVPRSAQRVDDNIDRIVEAFEIASARCDIILVTGGLGPTSDDITAEAFAKFLGEPLEIKADALEQLSARLKLLNRPVTDAQRKQARLPRPCFVLANPEGTAPGFALERPNPLQKWFFMPGVPREMKRMMTEQVAPRLPRVEGYRTYTWATHFTAEATLQDQLTPIERRLPAGFEVTYRTRFPENHVGLHAECATPERAALFEKFKSEIGAALGDSVFTSSAGALASIERVVVEAALEKRCLLSTVESCTGGLIASRLTDISGSSAAFWFADVVYDNAAKVELGVPEDLIAKHGAVSREVAIALAEAGLAKLKRLAAARGMDTSRPLLCVATTGIAGPTGGSADKPVGLCHLAMARSSGATLHESVQARPLDRTMVKAYFAQKALDLLRLTICSQPG